jgi:hypothetical protein
MTSEPGPSTVCPLCEGNLWVCVDHGKPWPDPGCGAEGRACVCNPKREVAWINVFADNRDPGDEPKQ